MDLPGAPSRFTTCTSSTGARNRASCTLKCTVQQALTSVHWPEIWARPWAVEAVWPAARTQALGFKDAQAILSRNDRNQGPPRQIRRRCLCFLRRTPYRTSHSGACPPVSRRTGAADAGSPREPTRRATRWWCSARAGACSAWECRMTPVGCGRRWCSKPEAESGGGSVPCFARDGRQRIRWRPQQMVPDQTHQGSGGCQTGAVFTGSAARSPSRPDRGLIPMAAPAQNGHCQGQGRRRSRRQHRAGHRQGLGQEARASSWIHSL